MSNPVSHPTRQQLDELDALMQRMLALPVSPADAEPATDTLVSEPPFSVTSLTDFTASLPPAPPAIEEAPREPIPAPPDEEPTARTAEHRPQIAAWVRPLLWSNRVFDRSTVRFGAGGRWLRGSGGRAWLGAAGLVMLATAVAWGVLDWMGWPW